jgi:predicted patatin/cPLA2 family phospholipase
MRAITAAIRRFRFIALYFSVVWMSGCALPRNPVPLEQITGAKVPGIPEMRYWEIQYHPDIQTGPSDSSDCSFLALSGGGANGAFGAGFLCGWTRSGTRPNFRIVTGISTGSLIAPLAFLGPEYDEELKQYYTTVRTKDILDVFGIGVLPVLVGESYASTKPLQHLIEKLVDEKVLKAVAAEHAKGRRLYIGTTNLDAQRFIVWDMGVIAGSGNPDALKLFRKVMLASASIPGAFPPVYFDVEIGGKKYDEMHVDGGVITGVFGYGTALFDKPQAKGLCRFYVIKNGKLDVEAKQVRRRFFSISGRSLSTLMKAQSWGDMIRLYKLAQDDNVDFHYISIPNDYEPKGDEMFDPEEMKQLYDLGYKIATSENPWQKELPIVRESREFIWTPAR